MVASESRERYLESDLRKHQGDGNVLYLVLVGDYNCLNPGDKQYMCIFIVFKIYLLKKQSDIFLYTFIIFFS